MHRGRNGPWRLFRNAMIAGLNDNLFAIGRQVSELGLQLMYPDFVKLRDFLGNTGIVWLPILSGCENDQWAIP